MKVSDLVIPIRPEVEKLTRHEIEAFEKQVREEMEKDGTAEANRITAQATILTERDFEVYIGPTAENPRRTRFY
ncbi:MAG: hypothetical protein AABW79_03480 [Nanoarchaeota archaeon]